MTSPDSATVSQRYQHTMKQALTPQQILQAWQQGMSNPQTATNYTNGINAVTESPMAAAATPAAMQAYVAGVQNSVNNGSRAAALNGVSISTWKNNATTVGAQRLASGAQKASPKYLAAMQKWAPLYAQASQAAAAITGPKGNLATALAKVQASLTVMISNGKRSSGAA